MGIPSPLVGTFAQNTTAQTTLNVPYPASLTSSHILVLAVSNNHATIPASLPPGGWTQVFRATNTAGTASPGLLVAIKQATGSESGNLAVTTPSAKSSGQIIAFTGVNLTTPQDVTATSVDQTSSTTTIVIPTLTTTRDGCALVYCATHNTGSDTSTPPTAPATFTETGDNPGAGGWAFGMGYLIWASSGATGSVTVTFSSGAKGLGVLVALRALDQSAGSTVNELATVTTTAAGTHNADSAVSETATVTTAGFAAHMADAAVSETVTVSTDADATHPASSVVNELVTVTTAAAVDRPVDSAVSVTAAVTVAGFAGHKADLAVTETATVTTAAVAAHPASSTVSTTATVTTDATVTAGGNFKVYIGGAWTSKATKVYVGGAWVHKPVKTWNGSAWVTH